MEHVLEAGEQIGLGKSYLYTDFDRVRRTSKAHANGYFAYVMVLSLITGLIDNLII